MLSPTYQAAFHKLNLVSLFQNRKSIHLLKAEKAKKADDFDKRLCNNNTKFTL